MSVIELILWWSALVLGMAGSALYSGLETGAYSLNRIRLQIKEHQGSTAARTLQRLLRRPIVLLGTLLVGNNVANYAGTASLAVLLEDSGFTDGQVIVFNVLIITPLLLVFGETLPKDLFAAHGDRLMYRFARFLSGSRILFTWTGLLPLIQGVSLVTTRLLRAHRAISPFHPRRHVQALVHEGVGHGLLSDVQSAIVERVLELSQHKIGTEAVGWKQVIKVREDDPPEVIWSFAERTSHSRFPVVSRAGQVVGVISVYDVLSHAKDRCPSIRQLMTPASHLDADTPIRDGLAMMQKSRLAMGIVMRHNRPVGIVTVKDLVEPITGELASW